MRSEMKIIIAVIIAVIVCCAVFGGYLIYSDIQKENEKLNQSLQEVQTKLNESQNNSTKLETSTSGSSSGSTKQASSTPKASSSSGNKVTYEEAGVNKNVGYIKTCKYKGCGARYNSRLSHCPSCGQKNIYKIIHIPIFFFLKTGFENITNIKKDYPVK